GGTLTAASSAEPAAGAAASGSTLCGWAVERGWAVEGGSALGGWAVTAGASGGGVLPLGLRPQLKPPAAGAGGVSGVRAAGVVGAGEDGGTVGGVTGAGGIGVVAGGVDSSKRLGGSVALGGTAARQGAGGLGASVDPVEPPAASGVLSSVASRSSTAFDCSSSSPPNCDASQSAASWRFSSSLMYRGPGRSGRSRRSRDNLLPR